MSDTFINIPSSGSRTWKDPVADFASLPMIGNSLNDVRSLLSTQDIYIWNGSAWTLAGAGAGIVHTVNGQSGTVILTTDNISEGATNLYYTQGRFDSAFTAKSTTNLSEGTNLYYTATRFNTAFSAKNTDNLTEGSTNLYFTNGRAQTAAVENAINSGTTNKAPSEDAVFTALALKQNSLGYTPENVANKGQPSGYASLDASGLVPLAQTSPYLPVWTKYTKTFSDLATAALTNSITLFALPAKGYIHQVVIKHSTAFSGGLISAYSVSVGIAGTVAKYASAFDVFAAVTSSNFQASTSNQPEDFLASTNILLSATSVGDNLDQAAAGSVDIWVLTSVLP